MTRIHEGQMGLWVMNADGSDLKPLLNPTQRRRTSTAAGRPTASGSPSSSTSSTAPTAPFRSTRSTPTAATRKRWCRTRPSRNRRAGRPTASASPGSAPATAIRTFTPPISRAKTSSDSPTTRARQQPQLVARRQADRLLQRPQRTPADPRHGRRRRQRPPLTNHDGIDYWPVWSPDGKRIAFTSNRDGNYEIYVMDADGGNQRNLTHVRPRTTSPRGRRTVRRSLSSPTGTAAQTFMLWRRSDSRRA